MPKIDPRLTPSEQTALMNTMANTYGACTCGPNPYGGIRRCPGHQFLSETDRQVSRLDKLLWIRRTAPSWVRAEQTGTCKACGEVGYHAPGQDVCIPCSMLRQTQAAHTGPLPW